MPATTNLRKHSHFPKIKSFIKTDLSFIIREKTILIVKYNFAIKYFVCKVDKDAHFIKFNQQDCSI